MGPYIVDFYCATARLVIEVDGLSHAGLEQEREDAKRARYLEAQGLRVLRVTNDRVLENVDEVAEGIALEAGVQWE